jgi:excisionase family DNA binding protein
VIEIQVVLTDAQVELIAERAAALVTERHSSSPWLDAKRAAEYLSCGVDRVYDLVQLGKLAPRRDGRRLLFGRDDLDAYLEASA